MLVKCPECQNDVSSSAVSCPHCGHPLTLSSTETLKQARKQPVRSSHAAGGLSFVALIFACFTPAILSPIFVLIALGFAVKESNAGGKLLGAMLIVLSLFQGWAVVDHFGHVSGSLGLVTAADADRTAAVKYANVSLELPQDWQQIAQTKCEEEWPDDYQMRKYCVKQQSDGVNSLAQGKPSNVDDTAFTVIRGKCSSEWSNDFNMRAYCEKEQYKAYRALQSTSSDGPSSRNSCAQQWPADYNMRHYCETHQ